MMPWFIWKNKNSLSDFGLWINKLPSRTRPEERHEEIEIPGRAGSLLMLEGDDVYSSFESEMTVIARNTLNMDKIMDWLRGTSQLVLSTDISKARTGRIVGEVSFERDGNNMQVATIPFLFQPFRRSVDATSDKITITGTSADIYNPGDVASRPKVKITGSGTKAIVIGGRLMTFDLGESETSIIVDCEAQIITSGLNMWEGTFAGDFWKIPRGGVEVINVNTANIEITPNWGWL